MFHSKDMSEIWHMGILTAPTSVFPSEEHINHIKCTKIQVVLENNEASFFAKNWRSQRGIFELEKGWFHKMHITPPEHFILFNKYMPQIQWEIGQIMFCDFFI